MTSPESIAEILWRLVAAFPNQKISQETIEVYVAELSDLDIDTIETARAELVKTEAWFPSIAALRKIAAPIMEQKATMKEFARQDLERAEQRKQADEARKLIPPPTPEEIATEKEKHAEIIRQRQQREAEEREAAHITREREIKESSIRGDCYGLLWTLETMAKGNTAKVNAIRSIVYPKKLGLAVYDESTAEHLRELIEAWKLEEAKA